MEVSSNVKYYYNEQEKYDIIHCFYEIIIKFIKLYDFYNINQQIEKIYLGCITHCGIDDKLEKIFQNKEINLLLKERVTINSIKNNYLLIYDKKEKEKENGKASHTCL